MVPKSRLKTRDLAFCESVLKPTYSSCSCLPFILILLHLYVSSLLWLFIFLIYLFLSILLNFWILLTFNLYFGLSWRFTKLFCLLICWETAVTCVENKYGSMYFLIPYFFTLILYSCTLEPAGPVCGCVQDLSGVYLCSFPALVWWGEDGWTDVSLAAAAHVWWEVVVMGESTGDLQEYFETA